MKATGMPLAILATLPRGLIVVPRPRQLLALSGTHAGRLDAVEGFLTGATSARLSTDDVPIVETSPQPVDSFRRDAAERYGRTKPISCIPRG